MTSSVPVFDTTLHKSNEWINEVAGELHTRAVFLVLARRVDIGEVQDVRGTLPKDLAALWPNIGFGND